MLGHGFVAAGSTPCDHFYHPEERAANGGLTLIGVNTAAGAAKLIAAGYVRFTKVRIVDTSSADGLARLPTGPPSAAGPTKAAAAAAAAQPAPPAHVPVPTSVTKEQLRSQPAPPTVFCTYLLHILGSIQGQEMWPTRSSRNSRRGLLMKREWQCTFRCVSLATKKSSPS